ncbi:MAG: hypothetical protein IJY58_02675 [Alphaproteobacteria bacterium]|nr:hypothetical protein [Alphaproteobacteria bacterium]
MKQSTKIRLVFFVGMVVLTFGCYYFFLHYEYNKNRTIPSVKPIETNSMSFDTQKAIQKALTNSEEIILTNPTKADIVKAYQGITMIDIPHVFVDKLPDDWTIETVSDKTLFLKIITALILRSNEKIERERYVLQLLQEKNLKHIPWNDEEKMFFNQMVEKYDAVLKKNDYGRLSELIDKINIIPPSIAVAQAILITDWGQKNKKSPYGEYAWKGEEAYVPIEFDSLTKATDSFALQINSRSQLFQFREIRRRLIPLVRDRYISLDLVDNMDKYMEWDTRYIQNLARVYQYGMIKELDHACFKGECQLKETKPLFN